MDDSNHIDCDNQWDMFPMGLYIPDYETANGKYSFGPSSDCYGCEIVSDHHEFGPIVLYQVYLPESLNKDWDDNNIELGRLWEISVRNITSRILSNFFSTRDIIYILWYIPIAPKKEIIYLPTDNCLVTQNLEKSEIN
jgi:hypothetical protein